MSQAINAMTAEMMAIAQKAGMSPRMLFNTIAGSDAASHADEKGISGTPEGIDPVLRSIGRWEGASHVGLGARVADRIADSPTIESLHATEQLVHHLGRDGGEADPAEHGGEPHLPVIAHTCRRANVFGHRNNMARPTARGRCPGTVDHGRRRRAARHRSDAR